MAEYVIANKTDLENIADSIREKAKLNNNLTFPNGFISAVNGISTGATVATSTIKESQLDYSLELTVPELVGAKYFIIKGNSMSAVQIGSLRKVDDSGVIHTLIYLNGLKIAYFADNGTTSAGCNMACAIDNVYTFNESTGTISFDDCCFNRFSTDTTSGDIVYTVYKLG